MAKVPSSHTNITALQDQGRLGDLYMKADMAINKNRAEKTKELLKRLGGLPPDPVLRPKPQPVQELPDICPPAKNK